MLEFEVKNQIIKRKDDFDVVADSKNYLRAHFELSEEWQGDVVALFGYAGKVFQVLLEEDNSCSVPFEVIKTPFFSVSLACGTEKLVTANVVKVEVQASGFAEGEAPLEPTPDLWQQYMANMQGNIENALPYIGDNGHWFLYNVETAEYEDTGILARGTDGSQGEKGADGQNGYTPVKGTDYWTEEDKTEIVGEISGNINWQLIESVTLEQDVQTLACDLKGGKYKELYIRFVIPTLNPDKLSDFPKGRVQVLEQGYTYLFDEGTSVFVDTEGKDWQLTYHLTMIGNNCIGERKIYEDSLTHPYAINYNPNRWSHSLGTQLANNFISTLRFKMLPTDTWKFPTGTTYELWGVKYDEEI